MLKGSDPVLRRAYLKSGEVAPQLPYEPGIVPPLLDKVVPLHQVIPVDIFRTGCPPDVQRIRASLEPLLNGEHPLMEGRDMIKFGKSSSNKP